MENKNNLWLFNSYAEPPKEALKNFDNGNFKGTDINTMWRIKCLTETFGICGIGWYYDIVKIWEKDMSETAQQVNTYAEIKLYVKHNGEWSKGITGVGGNKVLSYTKSGYWKPSDEDVKMAVTDALGNACRNLGIGSKVYWQNDRTKYTVENEQTEQTEQKKPQTEQKANEPTAEQLAELRSLGGTVQKIATYYKVEIENVTAEMVQKMIDKKKSVIAKEQKNANSQQ